MSKSCMWSKKYALLDELCEGGNAKVFKVREKTTNEEFALKSLTIRSHEKKSRFIEEINIASQNYKDIDGIIPILEASLEEYWYTMPVAQPILEHIEETNEKIEQIIHGVIQIAETLSQLHANGISHRDIKPDNIYYYNERYFLGDFGLVDHPDNPHDYTRSDRGLGATFTIAPEMKRDPKNADGKKADVYSLAKTTWMLLSGDNRGFDGVYNFLDRSHSLRFISKYKNVHTVELEELLKDSTNNNPDLRPDIISFKAQLKRWVAIFIDYEQSQFSDWEFLNKYLFGSNVPGSATWRNTDTILNVLNIIGTIPAYNHMLFSGHGGLDFDRAEYANEIGCINIYSAEDYCLIVKPKCLYFENFNKDYIWNYFLLELEQLTPIINEQLTLEYEKLVEDSPAHYVSAENAQYGVYDYDTGKPMPTGHRVVYRYLHGKILIVLKDGLYNSITATYDGRHGMCSNDEFRDYVRTLIEKTSDQKELKREMSKYLNTDVFSVNPFSKKESPVIFAHPSEYEDEQIFKSFVDNHFKNWCFKELLENITVTECIKFYFTFRIHNQTIGEIFSDMRFIICSDGYIKNVSRKALDDVLFIHDRNQAQRFRERADNLITLTCIENDISIPNEVDSFFEVNLVKAGTPTHLFTKSEIAEVMRNADDRINNMLVMDENGYARMIQDALQGMLYPVRHETLCAGNVYVGKYSNLSSIDDDYISSLQGWLIYLETGQHVYMDYVHKNVDETELIKAICKHY